MNGNITPTKIIPPAVTGDKMNTTYGRGQLLKSFETSVCVAKESRKYYSMKSYPTEISTSRHDALYKISFNIANITCSVCNSARNITLHLHDIGINYPLGDYYNYLL